MPQPADAGHSLVHRVRAQAALAQDRMCQNRTRVAILQHPDRQGRLRRALREEAIIHCDLWGR
eukprot:15468735-Alexandrium_andersonii.AAC.1